MKEYAGIGSRTTPLIFQDLFRKVAEYLEKEGWTLRSGGADGADLAFESGVVSNKVILIPWKGFNECWHGIVPPYNEELANRFHPRFYSLSQGAKKLMSRNSYQILGDDLKTPVSFVLCWTENGEGKGGTGQALRIARTYKIPIFDAGKYPYIEEARIAIWSFLKEEVL